MPQALSPVKPTMFSVHSKTSGHGAMQKIIAHLEDISEFTGTDTEQTQGSDEKTSEQVLKLDLMCSKRLGRGMESQRPSDI